MSGTVCIADLQLDSLQDFCCILHLSVSRLTQELSNSANYFFPFCVTSHTTLFVKSLVQFFPNKCKTYSINNSKQHWLWSSNQTSLSLVFSMAPIYLDVYILQSYVYVDIIINSFILFYFFY